MSASAASVPPWLTDEEATTGKEEFTVQCSGILHNGTRCTRTCIVHMNYPNNTLSFHSSISYCYKHRNQQLLSTHGYAPLSQSNIQLENTRWLMKRSSHCRQVHWTTQTLCALLSIALAVVSLVLCIGLHSPLLGLLSVILFFIPMVSLAYCLIQMMFFAVSQPISDTLSNNEEQESHAL
jgi:hypothetical protein